MPLIATDLSLFASVTLSHHQRSPSLLQWILGYDGGTLFSLTGLSPQGCLPDLWTSTTKQDMQKPYEYVFIRAGVTIAQLAAERNPESKCEVDEICRCNDPMLNCNQQVLTRPPAEAPTLDVPEAAPLGGGTRTADEERQLRRSADPQAAWQARVLFADDIDEDQEMDEEMDELGAFKYADPAFDGFNPDVFLPPLDSTSGNKIDSSSSFDADTIIRVPVVIDVGSRALDGVLGENNNALLNVTNECGMHILMRVLEWADNRTLAAPKALFKASTRYDKPVAKYNARILGPLLRQKMGMTIRKTQDGCPKSQIGGSHAHILVEDILLLQGFDLTLPGLRDRTTPYPSEYMDAMAQLYFDLGDVYWVRWTMPKFAASMLELAKAMKLCDKRKLELAADRSPIFIHDDFEKHARRAVHMLAELYPGKMSWYLWQLLGFVVQQMRRLKVLGPYTQGPMEHVQQDVALGVKHSNNGANAGRMTNVVREDPTQKPEYMEQRKTGVMDANQSLWRRLFLKTLAVTKSLRQANPEVSYAGAHGIIAHLRILGRNMKHPDFDEEWGVTEGFVWVWARWRRISKMGSRLRRDHPHIVYAPRANGDPPHSEVRLTPMRSCAEVYGGTLMACRRLLTERCAERACAANAQAPRSPAMPELPAGHARGGESWRVGMAILIEIYHGVAFIMEILKTAHGRGHGRWSGAAMHAAVREAKRLSEESSIAIERVELIVRTHKLDGSEFTATEAARAFYDDAMFESVSREEEMLPGCRPIEDQQDYLTADVDELLEVLESDFPRMPSAVTTIRSNSCRATRGMWYETEGMACIKEHHTGADGDAQFYPSEGPEKWTLRHVQPARGTKLCMYFCVPRREEDMEQED